MSSSEESKNFPTKISASSCERNCSHNAVNLTLQGSLWTAKTAKTLPSSIRFSTKLLVLEARISEQLLPVGLSSLVAYRTAAPPLVPLDVSSPGWSKFHQPQANFIANFIANLNSLLSCFLVTPLTLSKGFSPHPLFLSNSMLNLLTPIRTYRSFFTYFSKSMFSKSMFSRSSNMSIFGRIPTRTNTQVRDSARKLTNTMFTLIPPLLFSTSSPPGFSLVFLSNGLSNLGCIDAHSEAVSIPLWAALIALERRSLQKDDSTVLIELWVFGGNAWWTAKTSIQTSTYVINNRYHRVSDQFKPSSPSVLPLLWFKLKMGCMSNKDSRLFPSGERSTTDSRRVPSHASYRFMWQFISFRYYQNFPYFVMFFHRSRIVLCLSSSIAFYLNFTILLSFLLRS